MTIAYHHSYKHKLAILDCYYSKYYKKYKYFNIIITGNIIYHFNITCIIELLIISLDVSNEI